MSVRWKKKDWGGVPTPERSQPPHVTINILFVITVITVDQAISADYGR